MEWTCQILAFFICQITKTSATDFSRTTPHRAENQNLHMSVSIDPGGQTAPRTSITLTPALTLETSTPTGSVSSFYDGFPPVPLPSGIVKDNTSPLPLRYSKDSSLEPLKPSFGSPSSFGDGFNSAVIPTGIISDSTLPIPDMLYPKDTPLEALKLFGSISPLKDGFPPAAISSGVLSGKSPNLPAVMHPKDTSLDTIKPSFSSISTFYDGLPPTLSGIVSDSSNPNLSIMMYPKDKSLDVLKPSFDSVSPFYDGIPPAAVPSGIFSYSTPPILPVTKPSFSSVSRLFDGPPTPTDFVNDNTLPPLITRYLGESLEGLPPFGSASPIREGSLRPISQSFNSDNTAPPLTRYLGESLEGLTTQFDPISSKHDDFLTQRLPDFNTDNTPMTPTIINYPKETLERLTRFNPESLFHDGLPIPMVPIISDNTPTIPPFMTFPTESSRAVQPVPLIDSKPSVSPSDSQLVRANIPIIDNIPLISPSSPSSLHLTEGTEPMVDSSPSVSLFGSQLAGINVPIINNNPTISPSRFKLSEVPINEAIPNKPVSRPIINSLSYKTEVAQIGYNFNISSPMLNINFQINQLNVPPNMQKHLQPLQYNYNPMNNEIVPIVTNNLHSNSVHNPVLDQLSLNQHIVQPKIDSDTNNFITTSNKIRFPLTPPIISSDIIIDPTNTVSLPEIIANNPGHLKSKDVLKLVNTAANLDFVPEIPLPLQLNEYANENVLVPIQDSFSSLSKSESLDIQPNDLPKKPTVHLILNNEREQTPVIMCSKDISVINTAPSISTSILENVSDITRKHLSTSVDSPPNIMLSSSYFPLELPSSTVSFDAAQIKSPPNLDLLSSIPNLELSGLEFGSIRNDIANYNQPADLVEQTLIYHPPISIPSPSPYISQNINQPALDLDSFIGNTDFLPEIFCNFEMEPIISNTDKCIRNTPYSAYELELANIGTNPIISLTDPNEAIPWHYSNDNMLLNAKLCSNYNLKETLNTILSPLSVIPLNGQLSSNIPTINDISDFVIQNTFIESFPKSISLLNSLPSFQLHPPFVKSPSFLPKPSLSSPSACLSLNSELSSLSLKKSDSSINVPNTKLIPSITSITINIIPRQSHQEESDIIIIL